MGTGGQRQLDVTAIITFHKEGLLAHKSLLSLSRCRLAAEQAGISIEVIATLDCADRETERVVHSFANEGKPDRIAKVDFGDLGSTRNRAIQSAKGRKVLICDGDDYLSEDFIIRCLEASIEHGNRAILHAELVVLFGAENALWWQLGDDDPAFDSACMLIHNPWNSCCFAERSIFLANPYKLARPGESGFGFEDWHWNCETLAQGHPHRIARRTVHYVRKKHRDSLNMAHAAHDALIPPSLLFE